MQNICINFDLFLHHSQHFVDIKPKLNFAIDFCWYSKVYTCLLKFKNNVFTEENLRYRNTYFCFHIFYFFAFVSWWNSRKNRKTCKLCGIRINMNWYFPCWEKTHIYHINPEHSTNLIQNNSNSPVFSSFVSSILHLNFVSLANFSNYINYINT